MVSSALVRGWAPLSTPTMLRRSWHRTAGESAEGVLDEHSRLCSAWRGRGGGGIHTRVVGDDVAACNHAKHSMSAFHPLFSLHFFSSRMTRSNWERERERTHSSQGRGAGCYTQKKTSQLCAIPNAHTGPIRGHLRLGQLQSLGLELEHIRVAIRGVSRGLGWSGSGSSARVQNC